MSVCPASSRQSGFTLISLLVGLVISMVVLLATLMAFKNLTRASVSSREDSSADSLRLSSVLGSQIALQSAGFGLSSPALGIDMVALSGATLDTTSKKLTAGTQAAIGAPGNALVWGSDLGGGYQCEGLYAPVTGGLWRLQAQACTRANTGWSSLTWTPVIVDDSPRTVTQMTLSQPASGCVPFGITGKGSALVTFSSVTTRLNHSVADASTSAAGQQTYTSSICLANFP
jgi:hypothetical protein